MKELPHQELRNQYYEEKKTNDKAWENWEFMFLNGDEWCCLDEDPQFHEGCKYRRKPRTININGFEVPEPYRGELVEGQKYYYPAITKNHHVSVLFWGDYINDNHIKNKGFLHLNEEAARIHAKALLSFTNPEIKP